MQGFIFIGPKLFFETKKLVHDLNDPRRLLILDCRSAMESTFSKSLLAKGHSPIHLRGCALHNQISDFFF